MQFWNRFTGKIAKELPDQLILGQWQILTTSERVFINSFELTPNAKEYLFPDSAYRWSMRSVDGTLLCEKQFSNWQLPSDLLSESLRFFECELQKLVSNSATWTDWVKVPPLVPEIEQKISIQPLEVTTKQNLGHIEEVCHHPRTYLKLETERLPVSRAQRISPHATEFLAAHTEDWERRTFRSIVPKQVLCMVREELWDIYENKVTVRLIDNLLEYIRRRIQQVQTLKRQLDEAEYLSGTTSDIHWRNQRRIYTLWGNHFDAATAVQIAEATLRELRQLDYKLRSLIDTDLYKAIVQCASVGTTLKRTNILINDQHYRYVDLLWREWSRCQSGQAKNARQIFQENQELFRGFESFCLLLIGLALTGSGNEDDRGLGFQALANQLPTRGGYIILRGALGEVSLTWQQDGSLLLQSEGINDLRFVPITATLTATNNLEAIASILEIFSHNFTTSAENQTVILYPGTEEERKKLPLYIQRKMNTLGNDRLPGELAMAILPVSPLDIFSVERVARAIQWWLSSQRYQSYSPTLQINIPDALLKQEHIKRLQICPVCHSQGSFKELDSQCFRCECSSCRISWGTRKCGSCGKKYPYIQTAAIESQNRQAGWVERTLGREVLAVPCWVGSNHGSFICSHCGKCSQAKHTASKGCTRCH